MAEDRVKHTVVAIGGSAGSLEVILQLLAALPSNKETIYILILHRKNDQTSTLSELLQSRSPRPVVEVEDKEPIRAGVIYLAPPDYHLLIENKNHFSLDSSEKVQYSRPSIDVTFESIAEVFGEQAIGILLSGANADGAQGMAVLKAAGAITIAQDPASADVSFMPQQAINLNAHSHVLNTTGIIEYLQEVLSKD